MNRPPTLGAMPRALFALLLILGATVVQADPTKQQLAVEPAQQEVAAGGLATVTIVYDSDDHTLAGVAARLHYDSSKLTLESRELLFTTGITGAQDQPDTGDAYLAQFDDGDPSTDRRYLAAWAGVSSGWPGDGTPLPLSLVRLHFRVKGGAPAADLVLTGSKCNVCALEVRSAKIVISASSPGLAPTQTAAATAVPPTPTTTPTPGEQPPDDSLHDAPLVPEGGRVIEPIPTLSEIGLLLLIVALAGSAVAFLARRR